MRRLRALLSRVGILAAVSGVALVATAAPAIAHHPELQASTSCAEYRGIKWTIANSESAASRPMTIVSATAKLNGVSYPVLGYATVVPPSGTTFAFSLLPPNATGALTLTVTGTWPSPATTTRSFTVNLTPCAMPPTTTPTTQPPTTTTPTTQPPTTTTPTTQPPTTTTPTTQPPTTTTPTTQPPTTTTPTTEPPTTTEPPNTAGTTVPPVTEPPTTEPPTTEPPVTGPTTTEPPVTIGGSTAPPQNPQNPQEPPNTQLGTPVNEPRGSLPFTGSNTGWALIGIGLFCLGVSMACVPQRRSPARGSIN